MEALRKFRTKVRTSMLSAVACLCLGSVGVVSIAGCTPQQQKTTVQVVTQINAQMPAIIAGADTVAATVAALEPAYAVLINVGDQGFDALAHTLQALCASYLANPSATVLAQIQTAINTLESQLNTATLNAAGIKDAQSQQLALAALKGLLTVVSVVFGMISTTETKAELIELRRTDTVHLARVRPYMDEGTLASVARDEGLDIDAAFRQAAAFGF